MKTLPAFPPTNLFVDIFSQQPVYYFFIYYIKRSEHWIAERRREIGQFQPIGQFHQIKQSSIESDWNILKFPAIPLVLFYWVNFRMFYGREYSQVSSHFRIVFYFYIVHHHMDKLAITFRYFTHNFLAHEITYDRKFGVEMITKTFCIDWYKTWKCWFSTKNVAKLQSHSGSLPTGFSCENIKVIIIMLSFGDSRTDIEPRAKERKRGFNRGLKRI